MSVAFRLSFGRFAAIGAVSVSGVPHAFSPTGSRLTGELEGISSSKDDLGSYSSGFLTSLHRIGEEFVFEVQISRMKVSVFFFVFVVSRNLREAASRASSAVNAIQGAVTGAYGNNVNVSAVDREELSSILYEKYGGARSPRIFLSKSDGETNLGNYGRGRLAEISATDNADGDSAGVGGVRYFGLLELRKGLPALKASGGENQIGRLISSLLGLEATNACFIVNFKPHGISFLKKHASRAKAKSMVSGQDLRDRMRSYQSFLDDEKTVKELNEIRYGESSGYWRVSAHLVLDSKTDLGVLRGLESAAASLTSIFSDPNFAVEFRALKGGDLLRTLRSLPMRRLGSGTSLEMSGVRLSALVHMPTQAYPGIDRRELPEFEVPRAMDDMDVGKLVLGNVLHGDRELYPVGVDVDNLTLSMVVVGHIGSGKTMFVSQLLLGLWELDPDIGWIVFDVKGEYTPVARLLPDGVRVYRPGDEGSPLRLNVFDPGVDGAESHALKLFAILRDVLSSLFESSAELSPQMERLLRESLLKTVGDRKQRSFAGFYTCLEAEAKKMQTNTPTIMSSLEAIKNRVEKFRHGVLRKVFDVGSTNLDFSNSRSEKVIIDLSFLLAHGGTKDDVRLLMNVVLKNTFDRALKLGLSRGVRHIIVVEEAGLLVPEVFSRRTSSETTPAEDIVLVERALGEGMILVSPRPTISENVLANSGTKVVFRCPYDSRRVARFMNLSEEQENYLKVLPKREAIVTISNYPYPFRMRTLDSELPRMPLPQSHVESTITTASSSDQLGDSLTGDADEDADDSYDDLDDELDSETLNDEAGTRDDGNLGQDIGSGGAVDAKDLKRLMKKGMDSDRFKFVKAIALRSPEPVEASTIVEEEFGGEYWRLTDSFRVLLDDAWKKPLVKRVKELDNKENDIHFRLTDYGEKVWKAVRTQMRLRRRNERASY
jgi:hypothetical protein